MYEGASAKIGVIESGCEGKPLGAVRIDSNGNPQICIRR